jgi:hypothetical protein
MFYCTARREIDQLGHPTSSQTCPAGCGRWRVLPITKFQFTGPTKRCIYSPTQYILQYSITYCERNKVHCFQFFPIVNIFYNYAYMTHACHLVIKLSHMNLYISIKTNKIYKGSLYITCYGLMKKLIQHINYICVIINLSQWCCINIFVFNSYCHMYNIYVWLLQSRFRAKLIFYSANVGFCTIM